MAIKCECGNDARYVDETGAMTCAICPLKTGQDSVRLKDVPELLRLARRLIADGTMHAAVDEMRLLLGRPPRKPAKLIVSVGPYQSNWSALYREPPPPPPLSWSKLHDPPVQSGACDSLRRAMQGFASGQAEEQFAARRALRHSEATNRLLILRGYPPMPHWLRDSDDRTDVYGCCAAAWGVSRYEAKCRILGVQFGSSRSVIERNCALHPQLR